MTDILLPKGTLCYTISTMGPLELTYDFDPEKNLKLKVERGISFESIITAIEEGRLIDTIDSLQEIN